MGKTKSARSAMALGFFLCLPSICGAFDAPIARAAPQKKNLPVQDLLQVQSRARLLPVQIAPKRAAVARSLGAERILAPLATGEGGIADQYGGALAFDGTNLLVGAFQDLLPGGGAVGSRSGSVFCYRWQTDRFEANGKLVPPENADAALFGRHVALSGNYAVVGAERLTVAGRVDQGAAYIYEKLAGVWTFRQRLVAPDGAADDWFGGSVAIDGDRIAVGAPLRNDASHLDAGSVYMFRRAGAVWNLVGTLSASDAETGDRFGATVAIEGDMLVVGADGDDNAVMALVDQGSIYHFAEVAGAWNFAAKYVPVAASAGANVGSALALTGTKLFVGASGERVAGMANRGAVYAYDRMSGLVYRQQLVATDGNAQDRFGAAVAYDGAALLVGAPGRNSSEGAGYVFADAGIGFAQQALLAHSEGSGANDAGRGVAIAGGVALLGADLDDIGPNRAQGSVQRFQQQSGMWSFVERMHEGDGAAHELFGHALSLDGRWLAVGAYLDDTIVAGDDAGSTTLFRLDETGVWTRRQYLTAFDGVSEDRYGISVSLRNGWLAVGAYFAAVEGRLNQGAVYLYQNVADTWVFRSKQVLDSGARDDFFGYALAFDRSAERLLVGTPGDDEAAGDAGAAYLYRRTGAAWALERKLLPAPGVPDAFAGISIALGDGVAVVGAPQTDIGANAFQGAVHIFSNATGTWMQRERLLAGDGAAVDFFGFSIALDGGRLLVGAPSDSSPGIAEHGSVYAYVHGETLFAAPIKLLPVGMQPAGGFGAAVELKEQSALIGAPGEDGTGGSAQGMVHRYQWQGAMPVLRQDLEPGAGVAFSAFGRSLAQSETTVIVGAPDYAGENPQEGRVYVYADDDRFFVDGFE